MTVDSPEIRWPDQTRGAQRLLEARTVGNTIGEQAAIAYLDTALLAELELHDGRGGSPLYTTAKDFLTALGRLAEL